MLNELDEKARFTGQIVLTSAWENGTMLKYLTAEAVRVTGATAMPRRPVDLMYTPEESF